MLSPFDDFPIHQTVEPVAHVASGDRNAYDRYFFHGYDRAGEVFFGAGLALYPNRDVIDASFTVVRAGVQHSIHASGRLLPGERPTTVGPVSIDVVRPLHTLRVRVDGPYADELGISADITFTARTVAVQEPRHTAWRGTTRQLDATRLTQWGDWSGTIEVDGEVIEIRPEVHQGLRDRSWGIRPVGEPTGGAPSHELPQVFWAWSPMRFADHCLHGAISEHGDGRRWFQLAERTPLVDPVLLDPSAAPHPLADATALVEPFRDVSYDVQWQPGTRRARAATVTFTPWNAEPRRVELEPMLLFPMRGLGYISPDWAHGVWKGELVVGREVWIVAELEPLDVHNLHTQQLCIARCGDDEGLAVLELLALGEHAPSGLTGFLDGAS